MTCGCRVEPAWSTPNTTQPPDRQVIHFCPLHASALAMRETLTKITKLPYSNLPTVGMAKQMADLAQDALTAARGGEK